MTLHLHHPPETIMATEAATAHCSELTSGLIMALMAVPDLNLRAFLAAAACGSLVEAVVVSLPGGQEALDAMSASPCGMIQ